MNRSEPQTRHNISPRFVVVVAVFVTFLITANIMAVKVVSLFGLILPAAILIFPVSYIVGDILTEVYGYDHARRVIWLGFLCNLIAVIAIRCGQALPTAPFWDGQEAYVRILGYTPRILAASFVAYLAGEFSNAYVLAKMKIATRGKWLWLRTVGSTLVGQGLDSAVFISLAFAGTIPGRIIGTMILTQWIVKSVYEAAATPITYAAVRYLKRKDGMDAYDRNTRFNPFMVTK